jgi:hypothetical protein
LLFFILTIWNERRDKKWKNKIIQLR